MAERKITPPGGLRLEEGFFGRGDEFYDALLSAHAGLDEEESSALNTRLVLILANHIGDLDLLRHAIALARESLRAK